MYNLNRIGDGKMQKNGFITSALLYGILSLFLILVLGTVSILGNRKLANDKIKESALDDVQELTTDPKCFKTETNERDNLTITSYDDSCDKTVFIPETLNSQVVDAIGPNAFADKKLINITIKPNIKEIDATAFNKNDGMVFYMKTTSDQIVGTGSDQDINEAIGTAWGATNATVHWDY